MTDSLSKLNSYLARLTQQKARNKLTSTLDSLTQQTAKVVNPQPCAYAMKITTTGTGIGTVSRTPDADSYTNGKVISLTAKAQAGSKFSGWHGDVASEHSVCNVRMYRNMSVSAEFSRLEYFELKTAPMGTGSGFIMRSHKEEKHVKGSTITLTAQASAGSEFKCCGTCQ